MRTRNRKYALSRKRKAAPRKRSKRKRKKLTRQQKFAARMKRRTKRRKRAPAVAKLPFLRGTYSTGPSLCVPNTPEGTNRLFDEAERRDEIMGMPVSVETIDKC